MSLSNILQPNNYDIYTEGLSTNSVTLVNDVDDTKKVELSCNQNNTLVVGATGTNEILCGGIQFSPNQSVFNTYYELSSSYAQAMTVTDIFGNIISLASTPIKAYRFANSVTIQLPLLNATGIANVSTNFVSSPLPSEFRPSANRGGLFGFQTTNVPFTVSGIVINSAGVIQWEPPRLAAGVPGVWDSSASSTAINIYQISFTYII